MQKEIGLVVIPKKGHVLPFLEFREIRRGKNKGQLEVTIAGTRSRKVKVYPTAIRRYPTQDTGQAKTA